MDGRGWAIREGHRLVQVGMILFLVSLLVGLVVRQLAVPRLGLSAHLLGIMQGLFLMVIGQLWPRLTVTRGQSRVGYWLAVYGCLAPWTANILGALWGAGNTLLRIAAGQAQGSALQEGIIAIALRTGGASLIVASILILWGLRTLPSESSTR